MVVQRYLLLALWCLHPIESFTIGSKQYRHQPLLLSSTTESPPAELFFDDDEDDEEDDWLPDRERARQKRQQSRIRAERIQDSDSSKPSAYTEEEEQVIAAMSATTSKRDEGYLGDSTLQEIAMDYSVPICYIADVLCMWGCDVPIHTGDRLGDLVTGEQAFALLEAVNSLDISALQDRNSNQNLLQVCDDYEIDLQTAFEFCVKEGWSLPFGVQTHLRVEQEEELVRVHGTI